MGLGSICKRIGQKSKVKAAKERKKQKRKQNREERAKRIVIEDTELLSREQLKKIAKQPTNNIRVSGKRRRKQLKRLRHAQKEKSMMDVEASGPSTSAANRDFEMNSGDEESVSDNEGNVEMS